MELIDGYGWVLSAAIIAGWALSWWARRWIRWTVLSVAVVASLVCFGYGFSDYGRPTSQSQLRCSHVVECLSQHPVGWMSNGILGLECSLVLVLVTGAVGLVVAYKSRACAE